MLTCKSISKALLEGNYQDLPQWRQKLLKLHIRLCGVCGNYNGQVVDLQDGVHEFLKHEDELEQSGPPALTEECRERLRKRVGEANSDSGQ